jgi:hypothetical protein
MSKANKELAILLVSGIVGSLIFFAICKWYYGF